MDRWRFPSEGRDASALAPLIDPAYMTARKDLLLQIAGLRAAREIFAAQSLARECAGELVPGSGLQTDLDLERAVRAMGDCVWHPVGTCRRTQAPIPKMSMSQAFRRVGR